MILSCDVWEGKLLLTQPHGLPGQHKDVFTANATLVHAVLLLCRRREGNTMQVHEPLGEHGAQRVGPQWELACLDVVQLEGVVCEAKDQQRGHAWHKDKCMHVQQEGWEGGVVLYRIEVEDVHPLMVIRHHKPLVVGAYGCACCHSW